MINKNIRIVKNKENSNDVTEEELYKAPDGYFTEIVVSDILETSKNQGVIEAVCNKVRKNGSLVLQGVDGHDLCRNIYYGKIKIEETSDYFGEIERMNSLNSLKTMFTSMGWNVAFTGLKNGRYFIEVKKP